MLAKQTSIGNRVTSSSNSANTAAFAAEEAKVKKELKDKTKLLDEKLKELRVKEAEYRSDLFYDSFEC